MEVQIDGIYISQHRNFVFFEKQKVPRDTIDRIRLTDITFELEKDKKFNLIKFHRLESTKRALSEDTHTFYEVKDTPEFLKVIQNINSIDKIEDFPFSLIRKVSFYDAIASSLVLNTHFYPLKPFIRE